jgi:phosphatidylserine decarboxylase
MITPIKELRFFFLLLFALLFFYSFYSFTVFTIIAWVIFFLMLWLFRSKTRNVPPHAIAVLSPVDGTLLFTQAEKIPFLDIPGIHSRIEKSFYKEQIIYSPVEGTVKEIWFPHSKGSDNAFSILIETDEPEPIIMQMKPKGLGFSRFLVQPGQRVGQGRQIGICVFGHIIEMYIPEHAHIEAKNEGVIAAQSVIAELLHEN